MNLEQWRAQRAVGEEGILPSGLEVILQKVHIMDLVEQGKIPQQLHPSLERQMTLAISKGQPNNKPQNMTTEELRAYMELAGIVAMACIKAPEGLTADELPAEDKLAIYAWAIEGTQKLQPFRSQKGKPLESTQSSKDLQRAALVVSGNGT